MDFVAGCLGGCAGVLVGHPFDTVKVRLQLQNAKSPLYHGAYHCFRSIVKHETGRGLYKGVSSPLISLGFINAIVFGVQGNSLRLMKDPNSLYSHLLTGVLAGLSQCAVCSPMELAKTRMQMQGLGEMHGSKQTYASSVDCLKKVYKLEGVKGIGRGINATIVREIPSFGFYFLTYEYMCRVFTPEEARYCPLSGLLMAGGMAGCASWMCSYPVDVIKSRMQADGVLKDGKFHYKYAGYTDCIRQSWAEEGYHVLFRGLNTTLLRAFPTNAATFAVVAGCLRYMKPSQSEQDRKETLERSTMVAQLGD